MLAVDTRVLLRLTLMDDMDQMTQAAALIERALADRQAVFINPIVLAEYVWTLARTYRASRQEQSYAVRQYIDRSPYRLFDEAIVASALDEFENSKADFADCLIGAMNQSVSAPLTYSFDKAALELESFAMPPR